MPKIQNQITMRKVCIVIQSLLSRRPNHHSSYGLDHEKHHTLLTLKRRKNVVDDVTNVEQHELLGFDASRPLPDVIPERANSLAVVEGVPSRFFQATAAANVIGMSVRPALKFNLRRSNAFRASRLVSENSELFNNSSGSGSPPPFSRAAR